MIKSVIGAFCKRRRGSSSGSTPPGLKGPVEACGAAPQGVGRRRSARGQAQARANAAESAQARVGAVMRHSRPARPCPHRAESRYLPTSSDLKVLDIHQIFIFPPRSSTLVSHALPRSTLASQALPRAQPRFPRSSTLASHDALPRSLSTPFLTLVPRPSPCAVTSPTRPTCSCLLSEVASSSSLGTRGGGGNSVNPAQRVQAVRSVFRAHDGHRRCCRRTRTPRLKVALVFFEATSGAPL